MAGVRRVSHMSGLSRRSLILGVLVGVVAVGGSVWHLDVFGIRASGVSAETVANRDSAARLETQILTPEQYRQTIQLLGTIEPLQRVNVVAPYSGTIERRFFRYGDAVSAGDPLFHMDDDKAQVEYRKAQSAFIDAREAFAQLSDWEDSADMHRAARQVRRARSKLRALKQKHEETARLLQLGLVPESELRSLDQQIEDAQLELAQSEEELVETRKRGGAEKVRVARLKLENAAFAMREWARKLEAALVEAPVPGVVLEPRSGREGETNRLEVGSTVSEGETAVSLGDLTGIRVSADVDEVEIGWLEAGQPAVISGDAFPKLSLAGTLARVSAEARRDAGRNAPTFEASIEVPELSMAQRRAVRVGMSARAEIVLRDSSTALVVPIDAVVQGTDGPAVRVLRAGDVVTTPVEPGLSGINRVEILEGLSPGDEVVLNP